MKTILMTRSFDYRPKAGVIVAYREGQTYPRVPEAAVREILAASAGEVVQPEGAQQK